MSAAASSPGRDVVPEIPAAEKGTSLWADAGRRLRRNRLAVAGGVMLLLMVVLCFVVPAVFGLDPERTDPDNHFQPPDWVGEHPFGTDNVGRDYLARVLVGGQTSLLVGLAATLASVIIGVIWGAVAGYYGGKTDEVMMRLVDFGYAIPYMFLVILIWLAFGGRKDPLPVFFALGMVQWLTMARIVRGEVLTLKNREFVLAARTTGAGDLRIIFRHILPNVLGIVVVYATLTVPAVIILESFLSYLGLGVKLSWGVLVSEGVNVVNPHESHTWLLLLPSLFLALTLFSLNFLGDGLRDAIDPRTRR
jgi:oligopeptide transport system permease protein